MILHTIKSSPLSTFSLQDCLKHLSEHDCVLLMNDAVIAVSASLELQPTLLQLHESKRLFILQDDLQARGLHADFGQIIDYAGFVDLTIKCQSQLAW
ncbi:sulfurtransferase complex subunit TusB [Psychromonas sp. RZ22]|uniref:sulfurtransferase complex subunit TusB n=1 Tax=Psychromonas algarum TaxID=2555643 RepID=UPI001067C0BF|nr:sulfurtransferase complex subunit TusB [Psychromonas sp. RZ22]TEW55711.1 sulfurtransferase complex subunit TusB [Psychromonas sp. RZ22]